MTITFKRSDAATALERSRAALAEAEARADELAGKKHEALLIDEGVESIARVDDEIAAAHRVVQVHKDRIEALTREIERQADELRARERRALVAKIEAKLAERDKIGAELQDTLKKAEKLCRKVIENRNAIGGRHRERSQKNSN